MKIEQTVKFGIISVKNHEFLTVDGSAKHRSILNDLDQLSNFSEKFEWCQVYCKGRFEFVHKIYNRDSNYKRVYELFIIFEDNQDYVHYGLKWIN